jgi:hypothetical protein
MPVLRRYGVEEDKQNIRDMYHSKKMAGTITPEEEEYVRTNYPDIAQEIDINVLAEGGGGKYLEPMEGIVDPGADILDPSKRKAAELEGAGGPPVELSETGESLVPIVKKGRDIGKAINRGVINMPGFWVAKEAMKAMGVEQISQFEEYLDEPTSEEEARNAVGKVSAFVTKLRKAATAGVLDSQNAADFVNKFESGELDPEELEMALAWMPADVAYRFQNDPVYREDIKVAAENEAIQEEDVEQENPVSAFVGELTGMAVPIGGVYGMVRKFSRVTPFMQKSSLVLRAWEHMLQGAATGNLYSSLTMDSSLSPEEQAKRRLFDTGIFAALDLAVVLGPAGFKALLGKIKSSAAYQEIVAGMDSAQKKVFEGWRDKINSESLKAMEETSAELELILPEIEKQHKNWKKTQISTKAAETIESFPKRTEKAFEKAAQKGRATSREMLERHGAEVPPNFEETGHFFSPTGEPYIVTAKGQRKYVDPQTGQLFSKAVPAEKEDLKRAGLQGFSARGVELANKTSRSKGAVGEKAITPKYVKENVSKESSVLDFGAGKDAAHSEALKKAGFEDVTAYEFGNNFKWFTHDPNALSKKYDVVYASNVMNVQSSSDMARQTLNQMTGSTKGKLVLNYPKEPRYLEWSPLELEHQLKLRFNNVKKVGGSGSAPLFEASGLKAGWKDIEALANTGGTTEAWTVGSTIRDRAVKPVEKEIMRISGEIRDAVNAGKNPEAYSKIAFQNQMLREGLMTKTNKYPYFSEDGSKLLYTKIPKSMEADMKAAVELGKSLEADVYQATTLQTLDNFDPSRFANSLASKFLKKSKNYALGNKEVKAAARNEVKQFAGKLPPGKEGYSKLRTYMDETWGVKIPEADVLMNEVHYKELLGSTSAFKSPETRKAFADFTDEVVQSADYHDVIKGARQFYNSLTKEQQAIMHNSKTIMSLDFTLICPMKKLGMIGEGGAGKVCPYCYVFNGRVAKKLGLSFMEGKAETPFLPFKRSLVDDMPDIWVKFLNSKGGLRVHAFGDYIPDFKPMYEELIHASNTKGLKLKFITKQKKFLDEVVADPTLPGKSIQAQISVDFLPREVTNAPKLDQAKKWIEETLTKRKEAAEKAGIPYTAPEINIRTVVASDKDIALSMDPAVKVVTGYHGPTGEGLYKTWELANPTVIKNLGPTKARQLSESFKQYTKGTKAFNELKSKFPDQICCATKGGCATCKTCCGFKDALRMAIMTVDDVTPADLAKTFILAYREDMTTAELDALIKITNRGLIKNNDGMIKYLSKKFPYFMDDIDLGELATLTAQGINISTPKTGGFKEQWARFRETWIDQAEYVRRAEELPGVVLKEGKFKGPYETLRRVPKKMRYHAQKIDTFTKRYANEVVNISKKYKVSEEQVLQDVHDLAVAKHAPAYNKANGPRAAKFTTEEWIGKADAIMRKPHGEDAARLAGVIKDVNDANLKMLRDAGRISDDLYKKLKKKYPNYVPMQRDFSKELETLGLDVADVNEYLHLGGELNPTDPWTYAARGSKKDINNVALNTINNSIRTMQIAEKNVATQEIFRFVKENPQLGFVKVEKPSITKQFSPELGEEISVIKYPQGEAVQVAYFEGNPSYLRYTDPHLAEAFKQSNGFPFYKWAALRGIGHVTRFLSGLATRFNPAFTLPNAVRDAEEVFVYLASQKGYAQAGRTMTFIPRSQRAVWQYERQLQKSIKSGESFNPTGILKEYDEFVKSGSLTGGLGSSTKEEIKINLMKEISRAGQKSYDPRKMSRSLIDYVETMNEAVENGTRFAVWRGARAAGLSKEEAASLAATASIDFNKKGTMGSLMNSLWMFSNASVQGTNKMLKAFKDKPALALSVLTGLEATAAGFYAANEMIYPGWQDVVPEWDRENNLVIMVPSEEEGRANYVKIPISWGLKPFWTLSNQSIDYFTGRKGLNKGDIAESTGAFFSSIWNAANPFGGETFVQNISPTVTDVAFDLALNNAWYNKPISKPEEFRDPGLPRYLWQWSWSKDKRSTQLAQEVSRYMWRATGGEDVEGKTPSELNGRSGVINVTPQELEYIFQQYTSGPGKFAQRTVDQIEAYSKGKFSLELNPIFSRFYGSIDPERAEYYKGKKETQEVIDSGKWQRRRAMDKYVAKGQAEDFFKQYKAFEDHVEQIDLLTDVKLNYPQAYRSLKNLIKNDETSKLPPIEMELKEYPHPIKSEIIFDYLMDLPLKERQDQYFKWIDSGVIDKKAIVYLDEKKLKLKEEE